MITTKKLLSIFNKREKRNFLFLFILMVLAAVFETIGIGLIVPFVSIVTDPLKIHEIVVLSKIYEFFQFHSTTVFLIFATICLMLVFVGKNLYLILFYYLQYRFLFNQQVLKSQQLLKVYLTKPYEFHIQRNSSDLLRNVNSEVSRAFNQVIIPGFVVATEILVLVCILTLLFILQPLATLFSLLILGISVSLFLKKFRTKISVLGGIQQNANSQMIKWINQGLGASKEVKVSGKEEFFINAFTEHSKLFANSQCQYQLLYQVPRMFIETIVVATILLMMLLIILRGNDTPTLLSIIALFALAAFRLMPSITRLVSAVTMIKYNYPALEVIYEDLIDKSIVENNSNINIIQQQLNKKEFKHSIKLENIYYRYPNQTTYNISDISLEIPIGKSVAFIGKSGAGKTTIVDLILGLLEPDKGKILVDGKELKEQYTLWQQKIGYIPQSVNLLDDSIRRNVAFGINNDKINDELVWQALKDAQMKEFVENLPDGLDTFVGERGVRLSGGQRQRIGIARALYHDPEIIFLDEATAALDNETEKEIMKAIDGLKGQKTIIIIAHRLSTIENCDIVYELHEGELNH